MLRVEFEYPIPILPETDSGKPFSAFSPLKTTLIFDPAKDYCVVWHRTESTLGDHRSSQVWKVDSFRTFYLETNGDKRLTFFPQTMFLDHENSFPRQTDDKRTVNGVEVLELTIGESFDARKFYSTPDAHDLVESPTGLRKPIRHLKTVEEAEGRIRELIQQHKDIANAEIEYTVWSGDDNGNTRPNRFHVWLDGENGRRDHGGATEIQTAELSYYRDGNESLFGKGEQKFTRNTIPTLERMVGLYLPDAVVSTYDLEHHLLPKDRKNVTVELGQMEGQSVTIVKFDRELPHADQGWTQYFLSPAQGNCPIVIKHNYSFKEGEKPTYSDSTEMSWRQYGAVWFPQTIRNRLHSEVDARDEHDEIKIERARFNVPMPDVFDPDKLFTPLGIPVANIHRTPESLLDAFCACENYEEFVDLLSDESVNELAAIMIVNAASTSAWIQETANRAHGESTAEGRVALAKFEFLMERSRLDNPPASAVAAFKRLVKYHSLHLESELEPENAIPELISAMEEVMGKTVGNDQKTAVGLLKDPKQFTVDMTRLFMDELDEQMSASIRKNRKHWKLKMTGDDSATATYIGPPTLESFENEIDLRQFGQAWKIAVSPQPAEGPDVGRSSEHDTDDPQFTTIEEVESHLRKLFERRQQIKNADVEFTLTGEGRYDYLRRYHIWKDGDKLRADAKGPASDGQMNQRSIITPEYVSYKDFESGHSEFSVRSGGPVTGNASVPELAKFGFVNWNVESLESHSIEGAFFGDNRKDVTLSTTVRDGQPLTVVQFNRVFENGREGWGEYWLSPAHGNYPVYLLSGLKVRGKEKTDVVMEQKVVWRQSDNIWFPARIDRQYQKKDQRLDTESIVVHIASFNKLSFPDVFDPTKLRDGKMTAVADPPSANEWDESPAVIFERFARMDQQHNWSEALQCMTDDCRDEMVAELLFGVGLVEAFSIVVDDKEDATAPQFRAKRFMKTLEKQFPKVAWSKEKQSSELQLKLKPVIEKMSSLVPQERRMARIELVRKTVGEDGDKLFAALSEFLRTLAVETETVTAGSRLVNVDISGDKAFAVVVDGKTDERTPVAFRRVGGQWKLDRLVSDSVFDQVTIGSTKAAKND
jgi:hypothetical protein